MVKDTGEGIADDVRTRVFDPFFSTRAPDRMGLGLTVTEGVVTRHGGRLEIWSQPGQGTRVTIWLPGAAGSSAASEAAPGSPGGAAPGAVNRETVRAAAETGDRPAELAAAAPRAAPSEPAGEVESAPLAAATVDSPSHQVASILVLEDEDPVRALLVEALSQAGHRVETAVDGTSGLAKLDRGHFDVVLTDLALPQRSGLAVARAVKRMSPRTPVVLDHRLGTPPRSRAPPRARRRPHADEAVPRRARGGGRQRRPPAALRVLTAA